MVGEFFTVLKTILTKMLLSHINAGRRKTEDSSHGRRGTEDNGMENLGEDIMEEEDDDG